MDNLGGASFKVTADATSFMRSMDEAERKASTSSRAISTSVKTASGAYEVLTGELGTYAFAEEKATAATVQHTTALHEELQALTQVTARAGSTSLAVGAAGVSANRSAMGFLFLSQAVEDAQYGFSAIVNNIPMIVMAFGGSGGLAGAVSMLAVGANVALNHWQDMSRALMSSAEREAAEQMEALAEKTEKAAKSFEHLRDAKSKSETKSGHAFGERVAEGQGGAEKLQKQLSEALLAAGQAPAVGLGFIESAKVAAGALGNKIWNGGNAKEYVDQQIEQRRAEALAQKSAGLIGAAAQGDQGARSTIAALIQRNPEAFSPEFRKAFEESDPKAMKGKEDAKEDAKIRKEAIGNQNEAVEDQIKREKKAKKEAFDEDKKNRIQALQDQREAMQERHHEELKQLHDAADSLKERTQILQGPKAVSDMYQKAAGDNPLVELNKAMKAIMEDQRKELKEANAELKKQQRVKPA